MWYNKNIYEKLVLTIKFAQRSNWISLLTLFTVLLHSSKRSLLQSFAQNMLSSEDYCKHTCKVSQAKFAGGAKPYYLSVLKATGVT